MRQVKEHRTSEGVRYRVRYRIAGQETSETFRHKGEARTFAAILDGEHGVTEALRWLAARQSGDEAPTFAEWFESYVDQLTGVTPRTRDDYRAQHRRYLTHLDRLPITLITRTHITGLVNDLEADGRAPKTIKNVVNMLSSSLSLAVDEGLIPRNPCRRVRLPKVSLDADAEPRWMSAAEAHALLEAMPEHYRPFVTFLLGTGLRWSEATALQVRHIDLDHGTVRVRQAWKKIKGGQEIGPPKTPKANRTVNAAVGALVAAEPLLRGRRPNEYVFTTTTGKVIQHSNFYNRIWAPAVKAAGLTEPYPSPHSCRHTFASWLISEGIGLVAVRDQLGHESVETTERVYAKLLPAVGVAAGKAASAALQVALTYRTEGDARALQAGADTDEAHDPQRIAADVGDGRDG